MSRLIYADVLKLAIERYLKKILSHKFLPIVKNAVREVGNDMIFAIDVQPTVDAVPVSTLEQIKWERDSFAEQIREIGGEPFAKWDAMDVVKVVHGHWIKIGSQYSIRNMKCSICGEEVFGDLDTEKYCFNCGAKMDESTQSNDFNTLDALGEKVTE